MLTHRALALVVALLAVAATACGGDGPAAAPMPGNDLPPVTGPFAPGRTQVPGFGEVEVRVVDGPDGEPVVLCVLLAETAEQRARGLMEVTDPDLGGYDGMLFTFEADRDGGFWMRDTPLPLSIAFLDADGAVVGTADMDPCPPAPEACPSHRPDDAYRMALEVPRGGLDRIGLAVGAPGRLEVAGACAPA